MKKYVLILFLMLGFGVMAQENHHPNVDEMHERKWQYMVDKSQLSSQDAVKVKPVYMEYEQSVWKLLEQNKDFFHGFNNDKQNRQSSNYQEVNDRMVNIELQKAQLLKQYYSKLKKLIPAESIFKLFNSERLYRKELIKDWQGRGVRNRSK